MTGWIEQLDAQLDELLKGFNFLTTIILLLLLVYLIYPIVTATEPDTHPLLLSRQANTSPVRKDGQSGIYRSQEVPQGYPLKSGLNVKEPGVSKWATGRDGDVRDIWRQAVKGQVDEQGNSIRSPASIMTIHGSDKVVSTDLATMSKEINIIGSYIKGKGATCVGIYLPNSVELLTTVFGTCHQRVRYAWTTLTHVSQLLLSMGSIPY